MGDITDFIRKLRTEGFTGELRIHIDKGRIDSIEQIRLIPRDEYEPEGEHDKTDGS